MNFLEAIVKAENAAEVRQKSVRGRNFALVLYPDEDPNHKKFLDYVLNRPRFQVCFIFHDPETEDRKRHCHCLVSTKTQYVCSAFVRFFDPWIKHVVLVDDRDSYIAYMLHDTPHSIAEGKKSYSVEDLQGDERLWRNFRQNRNFVQFGEVFQYYRKGDTLLTLLERMKLESLPNDFERLFDFVMANSFIMISICNQEINKIKWERQVEK